MTSVRQLFVLVAVMGPYPMPLARGRTTLDEIKEMVDATDVAAEGRVLPDLTGAWGGNLDVRRRGLVAMRNLAFLDARSKGYSHVFIVENDTRFAPDVLTKLIKHDVSVVAPVLEFPKFPPLTMLTQLPQPEVGQTGLLESVWSGYPATLYKVDAFSYIPAPFSVDGEAADYRLWHRHGIKTYIDLDTAVQTEPATAHHKLAEMPFLPHRGCDKTPYEVVEKRQKFYREYRCRGCNYLLQFIPPEGFRL